MPTPTYITTAIPYVNAAPHIGFALELVQADAIARRSIAAGNPTRLQTGTDENAFKNVEAARVAGVSPLVWVDARAENYRQLCASLRIGHDRFMRTTEAAHSRGVAELWNALRPGDIFQRSYTGLYCSGCEDFLSAQDLVEGACPDHRVPPVETSETNHFFRLSAWQDALVRWLSSDAVAIRPEWRRAEILSFVKAGLQDISISRPAARSGGWGIPVPGDHSQVVYVWIDALVNYLSGLGYGTDDSWRQWWNADTHKIHVIGKNVWKFHAVYWPALLLSAGLPLPDELVIHGFLTLEGRKIGKSLGNAIDPQRFIERYGADGLRYFLLRAVPQFADADFSAARLAAVYEADLANGLGNLASRLFALAARGGLLSVLAPETSYPHDDLSASHDEALAAIWSAIAKLNRDLEEAQPWAALKQGASPDLREDLRHGLLRLDLIAARIAPFLPDAAARLRDHLARTPLAPIPPLFPRIHEAADLKPTP